ncbi:DUF58 domain-containing protein [Cytobacillus sp. Hz8]|uniref:DUF58 domain-containing protein n=1 Tax=Cytobacillus sp. Hz8 TaxID=3347168 RepID=UPI0035DCDDBD
MRSSFKSLKRVWKLFVLFLLIIITFSYAMFQGGFVSWFLFYCFLPFAIYGLLLAFYPLKNIDIERSFIRSDYRAGEKMQVTIRLHRSSAFPLFYMIVEDRLSEAFQHFHTNEAKTLIFPYFRKAFRLEYELRDIPRGEHDFQGVLIKIGDPLALVEREIQIPLEDRVVVYPRFEELSYQPFSNPYDQGMTASLERVQRDTSMAVGIREYHPGDRFSWINWKASAKRSDLMTKEFEQRQSHDVFLLMDCASEKRFEIIVSFTASIIRGILKKGAQVGLQTVSSNRVVIPINGGNLQQQKLFYHLAKIKDNCPVSLEKVLENDQLLTQQNVNLMIITAQITKKLIENAGIIAERKGTVTIFVMKEKGESITNQEIPLREMGLARGINIIPVHEGFFADAFQGVRRR